MLDLDVLGLATDISVKTLDNFDLYVEQFHFKEHGIRTQECSWKKALAENNQCSLHLKLFSFLFRTFVLFKCKLLENQVI